MVVVAVDIDGVLTKETDGWGKMKYLNRTPNLSEIDRVRKLKRLGCEIVLFSSRYEEDREVTECWLRVNKIPYDRLILEKPKYDYIIDDRSTTLTELVNRVTKGEQL